MSGIIQFGSYNWHVLDVQNNDALLLSESIIEKRAYNKEYEEVVTWETCTLRKYLNNEFFRSFTNEQQGIIIETQIVNNANQWYGTKGGSDTLDKIFLLSIEEVVKYFGDSRQLRDKNPKDEYYIDDQYNSKRIANFENKAYWWWLRSPGDSSSDAAYVYESGYVNVYGTIVILDDYGVRPALWLKVQ